MPPVAAIRGPLFHLLRVEGGLSVEGSNAPELGGLSGDGVLASRIGKVFMIRQPEARTTTCGAACCANECLIDVPHPLCYGRTAEPGPHQAAVF